MAKDLKLQIMSRKAATKRKKHKIIDIMNDKFFGNNEGTYRIKSKNIYRYLTDRNDESKKTKGTKQCIIKRKAKFEDFINCLEATQLNDKIIQLNHNKTDVKTI